ncbi:hypothetical protein [Thermus sp.]|uniref:hypothetical protein n=1 Tax=Thermus sp. TaxID=275 RepID=UPI003D12390A
MKKVLWLLMASAMALAAPATEGKMRVSAVFPPRTLPAGTVLILEDAKGMVLWESGKGMLPGSDALDKAAYVVFKLPKATYRYPVVKKGMALEELEVKVGKRIYTLGTLLKNRHVALGKSGNLVPVRATSALAPKKP